MSSDVRYATRFVTAAWDEADDALAFPDLPPTADDLTAELLGDDPLLELLDGELARRTPLSDNIDYARVQMRDAVYRREVAEAAAATLLDHELLPSPLDIRFRPTLRRTLLPRLDALADALEHTDLPLTPDGFVAFARVRRVACALTALLKMSDIEWASHAARLHEQHAAHPSSRWLPERARRNRNLADDLWAYADKLAAAAVTVTELATTRERGRQARPASRRRTRAASRSSGRRSDDDPPLAGSCPWRHGRRSL